MGIVGVARIVGYLDRRPELGCAYAFAVAPELHTPERYARVSRLDSDPWWAGPVGILLDDVTAIAPVPCKGAMGYWRVPDDVAEIVRARWKEARSV